MNQSRAFTVGLDIGDRYCHAFALNEESGEVIRDRIGTSREKLDLFFRALPPSRVVMEAGTHSPWISRSVAEIGHEVLVANPRRLRFIYASQNKSDRVDAEALSRVGRLDPKLLSPIQHRGSAAQETRTMLQTREVLVRMRTTAINHIRGSVKSMGLRIPKCSAGAFANKAQAALADAGVTQFQMILEQIMSLTRHVREADKAIKTSCEKTYPETKSLMQVAGVGPQVALAYVTSIEDPKRFARSREVGPYLGLVPRRDQSGGRDPRLGITKTGDEMLRRLLVNSAHYILGPFGPDTDLRRWGLRRDGGRVTSTTVIAVARRLSVILHRLWVDGSTYEPLRNSRKKERQKPIEEGVASEA